MNFDISFWRERDTLYIDAKFDRGQEGGGERGREFEARTRADGELARVAGREVESTYRFHRRRHSCHWHCPCSVSLSRFLSPCISLSPSYPLYVVRYPIQAHRQKSTSVPPSRRRRGDRARRGATASQRRRMTAATRRRPDRGGTGWLISWFLCLGRWHTRWNSALPFSIDRPCLPREQPDRGPRARGPGGRGAEARDGPAPRGRAHAPRDRGSAPSRVRGGRALTGYPRTFVVNAKIVLRQADVAVLVLGAPGARQRRLLFVHHRIEQLQPVHGLVLPRIRFPRLHNTPFIAGGGHHCHPLPHSPRSGHRAADPRFLDWTRVPLRNVARATLSSRLASAPLAAHPRDERRAPSGVKRAADRRTFHLLAPHAPPPLDRLAHSSTPRATITGSLSLSLANLRSPAIFHVARNSLFNPFAPDN